MIHSSMPKLSRSLLAAALAVLAWSAVAQTVPPKDTPDVTLRASPETVIWGYISVDVAPAATIKSGDTVKIDTVSHQACSRTKIR
jgi:hypothetical protein